MFTAKPVFVSSMFTVKSVFVNSKGLRVFKTNLMFTNFLSIWNIRLYNVRCMKYISLGMCVCLFPFGHAWYYPYILSVRI